MTESYYIKWPGIDGKYKHILTGNSDEKSEGSCTHCAVIIEEDTLDNLISFIIPNMSARQQLEIAYGIKGCSTDLDNKLILSAAEKISNENTLNNTELEYLALNLICIYSDAGNLCMPSDEQIKATNIAVNLSRQHKAFREYIIQGAQWYVQDMKNEDVWPHNPNSFDVLARIKDEDIENFLVDVVINDYGFARQQALESLAQNCPNHPVILAIEKGGYHDRRYNKKGKLPDSYDLKAIKDGRAAKEVY